ncbi:hypothetical protein EBL29_21240 [Salmonella enterica subsp. enterica serovar Cerro]|nr:hypothetical protein [Salmonella enterica subsp. enterica serovar Cerro]
MKQPRFYQTEAKEAVMQYKEIPIEEIKEFISYDELTGEMKWIKSGRGITKGSPVAKAKLRNGYMKVNFKMKSYLAHRVAYSFIHGPIPDGMEIDHINGIKDDNRISNLRLATRMQNSMNVAINHRNTSGVKGVAWDAGRSRWIASVSANGETFNIGRFKSIHAAERAVINARNKTNGEFSNHGEFKK